MDAPPYADGQILVALLFGPLLAVAVASSSRIGLPVWVVVVAVANLGVAGGILWGRSPAWRELGAGWLVLSSLVGGLGIWTTPPMG